MVGETYGDQALCADTPRAVPGKRLKMPLASRRGKESAMTDTTIPPTTVNKLVAEALGTFLLVFGGVGAALFAANFPAGSDSNPLGIAFVGVSLAFGLTVVAGAYAWGPISGGHFNP